MKEVKDLDKLYTGDIIKCKLKDYPTTFISRFLYHGLIGSSLTTYIYVLGKYPRDNYIYYSRTRMGEDGRIQGLFNPCWKYTILNEDEAMVELM